jgi:hypothetical protein
LSASYLPPHWSASLCDNGNCYIYDGSRHISNKIGHHGSGVWLVTISPDSNATGTGWVTEIFTDNSGITTKSVTYMLNALPLGIVTAKEPEDNINVYPNPAKNMLNIFSANPVDINIIDLFGKVLISGRETHVADVSSLNKGTYLINIFNKDNVLVKVDKLVKE